MGPYFEGGLKWYYTGIMTIQNLGPMLGDRRIYFGMLGLFYTRHPLGSLLYRIRGLSFTGYDTGH